MTSTKTEPAALAFPDRPTGRTVGIEQYPQQWWRLHDEHDI